MANIDTESYQDTHHEAKISETIDDDISLNDSDSERSESNFKIDVQIMNNNNITLTNSYQQTAEKKDGQ